MERRITGESSRSLMTTMPRLTPSKKWIYILKQNLRLSRPVQYANGSKNVLQLNMQLWHSIPNGNMKQITQNFVLSCGCFAEDGKLKKCTKIYNAHTKLLFCSLTLLFGDVHISIAIVVCSSSLLTHNTVQIITSAWTILRYETEIKKVSHTSKVNV